MESFGVGIAGLGAAGVATVGAFRLAVRQQRRRQGKGGEPAGPAPRGEAERLEALGQAQAALALRLDALAAEMTTGARAPEERLQAMAGQLLGLIRDKNATLETALAGLDQLRARMRALEQMGEPAEARALLETLQGRLDELAAAQATAAAALEAKLAALAQPTGAHDLAERLARLQETRDAGTEAGLARLAPIEAKLAELADGRQTGREALKQLEGRIEALVAEGGAARAELAGLKAEAGAGRGLAEGLARLHAQKEALAESLVGRIGALEAAVAAQDRQAALDGLAARLAALEAPGESPFAEISEQLTRLYAQKDATVETVFARLAPIEARLAELAGLAARIEALEAPGESPFAAISEQLTRLYAQKDATVETVFARLAPLEARLAELAGVPARIEALEAPGESPFAAISEQLTRLYAQKDATVETVFARLAPLEARLAEVEGRDPEAVLDRFAARLEGFGDRLAAIEDNPFAELSERLASLYAQKDATVETMFVRLAPLEARLAEVEGRDPEAVLDRFAARLEGFGDRLAAIEDNPFAELSERLASLYAQKDATVETVFARLAPLEARLAEVEGRDPRGALDGFAARLAALEAPGESPFAEISEQLTRLYAQKDATVETVFARLAPLESRLAEVEGRDPEAVLDRFAARLAALEAPGENPFAEVSEQLTRLYAQKDAMVGTVVERLAPLEARLAELEGRLGVLADDDLRAAVDGLRLRLEALAWAQGEVAAGLAAVEARAAEGGGFAEVADQLTRLFAQKDASAAALLARLAPVETRLAELEARPGARFVAPEPAAARAEAAALAERLARLEAELPRAAVAPAELEAIWSMPRIVSLHRKPS
jgi:chromosome segregation ATPase